MEFHTENPWNLTRIDFSGKTNERIKKYFWEIGQKIFFISLIGCLELDHLSLPLLVTSQFEVLASLQGSLFPELALSTFHSQDDFLGCLSLEGKTGLVEGLKGDLLGYLPSSGRWASFDHQIPVAFCRNDVCPGMLSSPWTSCTVSPCGACGTYTFCRKCASVWERSPGK